VKGYRFMASKGKKQPAQKDGEEIIHRFKTRPLLFVGTVIILVIVIVAFVLVPALVPGVPQGGDFNFGYYDKTPINFVPGNYFAKMQNAIAMQVQQAGINDQADISRIWRRAFEETVVHTAILQELKEAGYVPPVETVDRRMAQLPQFQEEGEFSIARYRRFDRSTLRALWRETQDDIAQEVYVSDILKLRISSKESAFMGAMASPERSFETVGFPLASYPESEIRSYAENNPELFNTVHLSMITIKSGEGEARKILDSIQEGTTTFEEAARTQSQDQYAASGGDMGILMAYELSSTVPDENERAAVLALTRGTYSGVIRAPNEAWAFFRCEETPYRTDMGDAASLEKVRNYLIRFERGRMDDWLLAQAEGFIALARGGNFAAAAAEGGLEIHRFGPIPLNYGGNFQFNTRYYNLFTALGSFSVPELNSADTSELFWRTAFSTPLETPSVPMVIGDYVVVLHPIEEKPAEEEKTEMIKSVYTSYWLSYFAEQGLYSHFMNSKKLKDDFWPAYFRYLWLSPDE
jgi:parvulin-like peptidyl-prolyl isomerase